MFALCTKLVGTVVAGDLRRPSLARGWGRDGKLGHPEKRAAEAEAAPSEKVPGSVGALLAFTLFGYQDFCPNSSHRKG